MGTARARAAAGSGLTRLEPDALERVEPKMSRCAKLSGLFVLVASVLLSVTASAYWVGDYPGEAGPPIDALIHLRLHEFLASRPPEGPFSLVLRAPFAALSLLTGGSGPLDRYENAYRFGVFPCVLAAGIVSILLVSTLGRRHTKLLVALGVPAVMVLNPASLIAVQWGHPEEILAGALVLGAALAALENRAIAAAVLLSLAVLTKEWAVVAAFPIAPALGWRRVRKPLLVVVGVTLAGLIPLAVAEPNSFLSLHKTFLDSQGSGLSTTSIWALLDPNTLAGGATPMPAWIAQVGHPSVVVSSIIATVLLRKRVLENPRERLLPLLALVLLLRALLDPINNGYYHVPFFMALLAADALTASFLPTAIAAAGLQVGRMVVDTPPTQTVLYLAWVVPFVVYLAGRSAGFDWSAWRASIASSARSSNTSTTTSATGSPGGSSSS